MVGGHYAHSAVDNVFPVWFTEVLNASAHLCARVCV